MALSMNSSILSQIEESRVGLIAELDSDKKMANGQFMTPAVIARAMADMFESPSGKNVRLLDPGAGTGALTFAFLEMLIQRGCVPSSVQVVAYEIDRFLAEKLRENSALAIVEFNSQDWDLDITIIEEDFISSAVKVIRPGLLDQRVDFKPFTHVILNPPYLKLSASSDQRSLLDKVDIRVNNLYSAFMALSISLLADHGHLIAITPRSFCNGPYFKPFRKFLLNQAAFMHIHVLERRDTAFTEDDVLQENIISYFKKNAPRELVQVSSSNGRSFSKKTSRFVPHSQIVDPHDPDLIIRIPTNEFDDFVLERMSVFSNRLESIGLEVSTGPVVDFRVRDSLQGELIKDCVPLIYPSHFRKQMVQWPLPNGKKPDAIQINDSTIRWLFPNHHYALVKRFSSKEERRRIYPACYDPIEAFNLVGFENHLNVIHSGQSGIEKTLSRGLVSYLSSTIVDLYFRQFSGHTQVNANDLRSIPLPPLRILNDMAQFHDGVSVQAAMVDEYLESIFRNEFSISSPDPILLAKG